MPRSNQQPAVRPIAPPAMSSQTYRKRRAHGDRDSLVGTTIAGRYRIERLISLGEMGRVYLASQEPIGRPVALKVINANSRSFRDPSMTRRFEREAAVLARLNHPHTVGFLEFGEWEGHWFLAMEYVDGRPLSHELDDGPIDPYTTLSIGRQLAQALRAAHDIGVVHRDIKPDNVLLTQVGDDHSFVKLIDFGLTKETHNSPELTRAGMIVGSPAFMAPEAINGEDVDARADVYSLGVLLFRALMGELPFSGQQDVNVLLAHLHEPVPGFDSFEGLLMMPACVEWTVRCCMEKDPSRRFRDMRELDRALSACIAVLEDPTAWSVSFHLDANGRVVLPTLLEEDTSAPAGHMRTSSIEARLLDLPPNLEDTGASANDYSECETLELEAPKLHGGPEIVDRRDPQTESLGGAITRIGIASWPSVWVLTDDPACDHPDIVEGLAALRERAIVEFIRPEERLARVEELDRQMLAMPDIVVFGDLHVILEDALLERLSCCPITSRLLLSTHLNADMLQAAVNYCGLDRSLTLPVRPGELSSTTNQLIERTSKAWTLLEQADDAPVAR